MIRKLLCLYLFCFLISNIKADDIYGGEIYYKQIDSFKYIVTLNIYRNCRSVALNGVNGFVYGGNIKYAMNFRRVSIENISENCGTACQNTNAPSNAGIEKHLFKDTIDFTQAPYDTLMKNNYCEITFGVFTQGWNNGITTINNPNFFIDAMVNICHQKAFIHSPEFSNKPLYQACCNQPLKYNPGILKFEDTDSFSFELAGVLNNYNTNATYNGSYTKAIPMQPFCPPNPGVVNCRPRPNDNWPRGFYYDLIVNDIVFTPTKCDEVGVIKFQVKQWRFNTQTQKMELIGYVNRQMLLIVKTCPDNNPPYFTSNTNTYNIFLGDSFNLNVSTKDDPFLPNQTTLDSTYISWSNNLENASFTYLDSNAREKTAVLKWKASGNPYQITQKYIHLKIIDKQCNVQTSKGVLINVYPKINNIKNTQIKDIKGCNYISLYNELKEDSVTKKSDLDYFYSIKRIEPDNQQLFTSNKQSDKFNYHTSGKYVVTSSIQFKGLNSSQSHFDTVDVEVINPFNTNLTNSLVCNGDSILLGNKNFIDSFTVITWEYPIGNTVSNTNTYLFIQDGKSNILRLKHQNNNCNSFIDFEIFSKANFNISSRDTFICKNKSIHISLKNYSPKAPYKTLWIINSKDSVYRNIYGNLLIDKPTTIKAQYIKNPKCIEEKTIFIQTSELASVNFNFTDSTICQNDSITLKPIYKKSKFPIKKYFWSLNGSYINHNDSQYASSYNQNQIVNVFISDSLDCLSKTASVKIVQWSIPNFILIDSLSCSLYNPYILIKSNDIKNKTKVEWWINGELDTTKQLKYFNSFTQPLKIDVKLYDTANCMNEKTIQTPAIARPKFTFPYTKYCNKQIVSFRPTYTSTKQIVYYNWFANGVNMNYPDKKYLFNLQDSILLKHIVKDDEGCIYHDSIKLKPIIPEVKILGKNLYYHNELVLLEADNDFSTYQWSNNFITNSKTNNFIASDLGPPGEYLIVLNAFHNTDCFASSSIKLSILPVSNINHLSTSPLLIFPNPSNALFTIKTSISGQVEIYNIDGKLLLNTRIHEGENSLNLETFSEGIYFLKFEGKAYKLVLKK
jgi:hypothetical protein